MKSRDKNMDLLRIISAFMVVMIHVSGIYIVEYIENINVDFIIADIFNSFARFAVPTFVMISGAFILKDSGNEDKKTIYKKMWKNIIIPTIIWSIIYFLINISMDIIQFILGVGEIDIKTNLLNWIQGKPLYHMWYLYMIIGMYLTVPYIFKVKNKLGERKFTIFGIVVLIVGMIISYITPVFWIFEWIKYIGYFILGYVIYIYASQNKNNRKAIIFLMLALFFLTFVFISSEIIVRNNLFNKDYVLVKHELSIFVLPATLCIFAAFSYKKESNFKIDVGKIANHTFNIYIIHAGIILGINMIRDLITQKLPQSILYIPIMTTIVFMLSLGISIILKKLKKEIKTYLPIKKVK